MVLSFLRHCRICHAPKMAMIWVKSICWAVEARRLELPSAGIDAFGGLLEAGQRGAVKGRAELGEDLARDGRPRRDRSLAGGEFDHGRFASIRRITSSRGKRTLVPATRTGVSSPVRA